MPRRTLSPDVQDNRNTNTNTNTDMNYSEIASKTRKIIKAIKPKIKQESIEQNSKLTKDLGLDSLDMVMLVDATENEFGINFVGDEFPANVTKEHLDHEVARLLGTSVHDTSTRLTYEEMVAGLVKPGEEIAQNLKGANEAWGLASTINRVVSAGIALEAVKKEVVYGKKMDVETGETLRIETVKNMTPIQAHKLHMAIGIAGEGIETLLAVVKELETGVIDRDNIIEEDGDMQFYSEGLRQSYGHTGEEAKTANYNKLSKRYAGLKYSDEAAQKRSDKQ